LLLVRQVGFEFLNYFMQQTSRKRIRDLLFHGTKTRDLSFYFLFASVHAVRRGNSSSCFGVAKLFILACTGRCDPMPGSKCGYRDHGKTSKCGR
jgi:hypothetical protein